jgi:hypothetical protein
MKGLLGNVDLLISHVLQRMNGSVSWKMVALMVAGGVDRVQSMPANAVAKYVMSMSSTNISTAVLDVSPDTTCDMM